MQAATQPQQSNPGKRMSLASVVTAPRWQPIRVLVHGAIKVGKTTFASGAKAPIIIGAEDGAEYLGTPRFPLAHSLTDVYDAIDALTNEKHEHQTLIIDTLDWLEALIGQHYTHAKKKESLKAFGYGEGYVLVYDETRRLISRLERLRDKRGMNIVLVAHSTVRTTKNPEGEDYDRYCLKLQEANNANTAGLWREWVDFVLFAKIKTFTAEDDAGRHKAVTSGERVICTHSSPAYDAGSRLPLPAEMPLEWGAFAKAVKEAFDQRTKEISK